MLLMAQQKETLSLYFTEAVGIAYEKTQREEVHSTLLPSDVLIETSYISVDDHFAALQIDLNVRGWKTFGGFYRA